MLQRIELELLATVEPGDTIAQLAARLDHSESYCSRGVAALAEKGLIHTTRDGRHKRVEPSDARAVELYQDLVRQYPHIDFPGVLTPKTLEVLYYLDGPQSVSEIASRSDNYRNSVYRVLKELRDHGIVGTEDGRYFFTGDFGRLHAVSDALVHHRHRHRLEAIAPQGTILWESYDEFLAQTARELQAETFHETGLRRFGAYDLQFLVTGTRYYFFSEEIEDLSPAELCCHTLLIDDGPRYRSYCLLLLSRMDIDEDELRATAEKYGLEAEITALGRYLETHGEVEDNRLPEWREFQELAREYGVPLQS